MDWSTIVTKAPVLLPSGMVVRCIRALSDSGAILRAVEHWNGEQWCQTPDDWDEYGYNQLINDDKLPTASHLQCGFPECDFPRNYSAWYESPNH